MVEAILQDSANTPCRMKELGDWYKSKQLEEIVRCFGQKICVDVGNTNQEGMCTSISSDNGDHGLIRGQNRTNNRRTHW